MNSTCAVDHHASRQSMKIDKTEHPSTLILWLFIVVKYLRASPVNLLTVKVAVAW